MKVLRNMFVLAMFIPLSFFTYISGIGNAEKKDRIIVQAVRRLDARGRLDAGRRARRVADYAAGALQRRPNPPYFVQRFEIQQGPRWGDGRV
jgi:hypothetical protein